MKQRFFLLDGEWNVIHLPERPNGFAVFIIGDQNHFVDHSTSFWLQNAGRKHYVDSFLQHGYTVYYSNLYGRSWGSPKAVTLAKRLYHIVMKEEILNDSIHILAEGMGALVGLELMESMDDKIRSVCMLNPCLDLASYMNQEQENKLFYKRISKEVMNAYEWSEDQFGSHIECLPTIQDRKAITPVKIWISTGEHTYQSKQLGRKYEESRKDHAPIQLLIHVNEKRYGIANGICQFFEQHELSL
ncbi:hypothetical protein ACFSCX_01830 [Bacillus salitolerans]|uniref:Alpha/beta hydrolase n=1 Tax=Bacillus salitolerans TaxID=1437434 RepID=A0ABW4LKQ9_9BACI